MTNSLIKTDYDPVTCCKAYYKEFDIERCTWNSRKCLFYFYTSTFSKPKVIPADTESRADELATMLLTPKVWQKQYNSLKSQEEPKNDKSDKPWFLQ